MDLIERYTAYFLENFFNKARIIEIMGQLFESLLILVFFYVLTLIIKFFAFTICKRFTKEKQPIINLLRKIINIFLMFSALIAALHNLGIDVRIFIVQLGLTGFALGYAFKDALANLLAGIMIILYKPFSIGDIIEVGGFKGKVKNIDMRHTAIEGENKKYLIPNSKLLSDSISVEN